MSPLKAKHELQSSSSNFLVDLYGVNKATSEKALALMKAKLDEIDDKIEKIKQKPKSKEDHFNVDK